MFDEKKDKIEKLQNELTTAQKIQDQNAKLKKISEANLSSLLEAVNEIMDASNDNDRTTAIKKQRENIISYISRCLKVTNDIDSDNPDLESK